MDYESAENTKFLPKHILKDGAKWLMLPSKTIINSLTLWPESYNFAISVAHFFFLFSYSFFLFGNFYYIFGGDADLASITVSLTLVNILIESMARVLLAHFNRERLAKLLHKIYYEFWPSKSAGDEIHEEIARESWYLFLFCASYNFAAFINVTEYIIVPLASRNMPLGTSYPFDWRKSPYYEILYVWEAFIVMGMPFTVCGYDMFIMSVWYNCVAQFKLLRVYLKNEFEKALLKEDYNKEAKKILYLCISQHNEMIGVCKEINGIYTYFVLLQTLMAIGAVCLSSFVGTVVPEELGTAFPYLIGHILLIFAYCYMGNELILESKKLSDAAFECGWNLLPTDKDIQKSLVLVMVRSQRPLRISTGGFGFLSLESFLKLLQFSFSVYTLLNSMMQKQNLVKQSTSDNTHV